MLVIDEDRRRRIELIRLLAAHGMTPLAPNTVLEAIDLLTRAHLHVDVCLLAESTGDTTAELGALIADSFPWVATAMFSDDIEATVDDALDAWADTDVARIASALGQSVAARPQRAAAASVVLYAPRAGGGLLAEDPVLADYYLPGNRLLMGGGGLLSTVTDYLRFAQMLLNGGEVDGRRVLTQKSVALMMRNHLPVELTPIEDAIVGHSGYRHGLGGVVLVDSARAGLPGSPGIYRWWGIAGTFFWIDPKADLIGMVWTQLSPGWTYPLEQDFQPVVYQALR